MTALIGRLLCLVGLHKFGRWHREAIYGGAWRVCSRCLSMQRPGDIADGEP
jgi:hypothetical protein